MLTRPVAVILFTKDAAALLPAVDAAVGSDLALKLVVDSSSRDGTVELASRLGWVVTSTPAAFDHGGSRRWAVRKALEVMGRDGVVVLLTQDAVPSGARGEAIKRLAGMLEDHGLGAAYGRQLPRPGAGPFEAHARLFNYPDRSEVRSMEDGKRLGIKACFFSDSFAAYRLEALEQVGGFPERAIVGEDVIVAAKLLKAGWKIAYVADACVYHSHDLTPLQEMRRYFDIGVFHARESWILREFGKPEGEGLRFLRSELRYLWQHAPWRIPESFLRAALKYLGYRLGRAERWLPLGLKRWLSLQKHFWDREAEELRARKRGDRARGE
jgi:rhamnosyltransferase